MLDDEQQAGKVAGLTFPVKRRYIHTTKEELGELLQRVHDTLDTPHPPQYGPHPSISIQIRLEHGIEEKNEQKLNKFARAYVDWVRSGADVEKGIETLYPLMR